MVPGVFFSVFKVATPDLGQPQIKLKQEMKARSLNLELSILGQNWKAIPFGLAKTSVFY